MNAREQIMGQNWIEQFRRERARINNNDAHRQVGDWNEGEDIFDANPDEDADAILNIAFPWEETREGHHTWCVRANRICNIDELVR